MRGFISFLLGVAAGLGLIALGAPLIVVAGGSGLVTFILMEVSQ